MAKDLSAVGDHFIVGLSGPVLLPEEREMLARLRPLGIILFAKNFVPAASSNADTGQWRAPLQDLLADASAAAGRTPFFISIDHEGGRVHRFPAPVTKFPAARHWGTDSGPVSEAMGRELRAMGFNLSYAPVLDIHSEPANSVIGDRAFATEPEEVIRRGKEALTGLHRAGVLSCCKHFPGHGDTTQDSHHELPYLEVSRAKLDERELRPFRELIAFGAPLVMTAHVRYLAFDEGNPASLSSAVITGLLRNELGFRKAVITDDLEMRALAGFSPAERALRAISAGTDILLEANPKQAVALEIAVEMAEALHTASERGELDLAPSRRRIEDLLTFARGIFAVAAGGPEIVGCAEHTALAAEVALRKV